MAVPGFLNDNTFRAYPLVGPKAPPMVRGSGGAYRLPEATLADLTAVIGPAVPFDPAVGLRLAAVSRAGGTLTFLFAGGGVEMPVEVPEGAAEFSVHAGGAAEDGCDGDWADVRVTVGLLADLLAILPDGDDLTADDETPVLVEPARVQSLAGSYVTGISVANAPRTTAAAPDGCPGSSSSEAAGSSSAGPGDGDVIVSARCLRGEVRFIPGYNCTIRQSEADNALVIGAAVGAGDGEPCGEEPLYEGETSPDGGTLLSGGPSCGQVIQRVAGLAGPNVQVIGGPGVVVRPSEEAENTLLVDVNFRGVPSCDAAAEEA
jgi:hypothetical protein